LLLSANSLFSLESQTLTVARERSTALNLWYSPTNQLNTANLTLLPKDAPVVNPERKRYTKTFILKGMEIETFRTVNSLWEEILEQLGKNVVSFMLDFGVGYMAGNQRICFGEKDETELQLQG